MVERIGSGVPGLDELVDGGLPADTTTLVAGGTGSGKTTFCTQFLWQGLQQDETCLFVTTEERPAAIRADAAEFGMDVDDYDEEQFSLLYIDPSTRTKHVGDAIVKAVDKMEPDRVVVDSLSVIGAYWGSEQEIRSNIHALLKELDERDCTVVMTAEAATQDANAVSRYGIAEYLVDAVIALRGLSIGQSTYRSLQVIKMRRTSISEEVHSLDLGSDGLQVLEEETF